MRIALDIDGTIDAHPEFFSWLSHQADYVLIITDSDEYFREQIHRRLEDMNIKYDDLEITNNKTETCRIEGIDYLIDDDIEYFQGFEGNVTPLNLGRLAKGSD